MTGEGHEAEEEGGGGLKEGECRERSGKYVLWKEELSERRGQFGEGGRNKVSK